ncbi:UPF0426 protein [Quillaja saponaria]|uniref:UPF0426 protein n=1 Tax=Quillaja saponaria TaxID=32244 RepID=A0AAD7PX04_QUISA|nr:UPF0426 protein [Quillaja saponaria]
MSALLVGFPQQPCAWKSKKASLNPLSSPRLVTRISSVRFGINTNSCKNGVRAFFFNPVDERIVREALKVQSLSSFVFHVADLIQDNKLNMLVV